MQDQFPRAKTLGNNMYPAGSNSAWFDDELKVPKEGVDGYLTDYTIPETAQPSSVFCCQCDSIDPPILFCPDCAGALCQFCSQAHRRIKMFQAHVTIPLSSETDVLPKIYTKRNVKITCPSHPQQHFNVYCKSCHTLVCCECLIAYHQAHELAVVNDETRREVQEEISHLLEKSNAKLCEMVDAKEYTESVEAFLLERSEQLKKTINVAYKKVFDTLKRKQENDLSEAEAICSCALKTVWSDKDYIDRTCTSLETAVNFAKRNFHCSNIELLQMSTQVISRLKELNVVQWNEAQLERVQCTLSDFMSTSHDLSVGKIKTWGCKQANTKLQVGSIPPQLPLAKAIKVDVHLGLDNGQSHPLRFKLPLVGANVTYGSTKKKLPDACLSVSKKKWGHWEISFTAICGGEHEICIFMVDQGRLCGEFKQTLKVIRRPWINARVKEGPDYGEPKIAATKLKSGQQEETAKENATLNYVCHRPIAGEGRVRNSYYPSRQHHNMILVEWDIGGCYKTYRWGHDGYFDIELVL